MSKQLVVLGSVNQDLIITTPRLPALGETITGSGFASAAGGKGANQAVAAARLGANVAFIAAVGGDMAGREMKAGFAAEGIDVTHVREIPGVPTGTAVITLCGGDNHIVLDPGANACVTAEWVSSAEEVIANAGILILQLEIPLASVTRAVDTAKKYNVPVMLNPAPAVPLPAELLERIDILTPNESECAVLTGISVNTIDDAKAAVKNLTERGVGQVIVTLGSNGAVYNKGSDIFHEPACPAERITDTTAAGDCFTAAAAVALMEGRLIAEAVRFAAAAAAISVTRMGAQPSLPRREEIAFCKISKS